MQYTLKLNQTAAGAGYFACRPPENLGFDAALAYLSAHPRDDFMHKHLLAAVLRMDDHQLETLLRRARRDDHKVLLTLLVEAGLASETHSDRSSRFSGVDTQALGKGFTPLIDIKASHLDDRDLHFQWIQRLGENILAHRPLVAIDEMDRLPGLPAKTPPAVHLRALWETVSGSGTADPAMTGGPAAVPPETTYRHAIHQLEAAGILEGIEMRHIASLSPWALLREWRLSRTIRNGGHAYTLEGTQTAYGRGLTLADARASYAMEIVERCSAFADFGPAGTMGYPRPHNLEYARFDALHAAGRNVLDPNSLGLEAPYENEPLYWITAQRCKDGDLRPILIPAQAVFLFCNLDEINLFSGLGSTGLASGNSMAEARLRALLELIERDCEAVTPYIPTDCFTVTADDAAVAALLADYRRKGIGIQFQDLTPPSGVPCYKCFVIGQNGCITKGTGAHLNARRALIAALTETPYPYPQGPASAPVLADIPIRRYEDLPDYATGNAHNDLTLLENLLNANGMAPVYVDLTRADLGIPVARAIVPGFELMADFDRFSRVSPRLLANYLARQPQPAAGASPLSASTPFGEDRQGLFSDSVT